MSRKFRGRKGSIRRNDRRRERAASSSARRLGAERLESRHMLAAVSLVDGSLLIADDGGSTNDNVTIVANAVDQRYEITDFANLVTTSIAGATGSGTTTVHVPFASVTGTLLAVAFQGGNDTTNVRGDFPVGVTISGGSGSDHVNFNGDTTLTAGRSLTTTVETLDVFSGTDIVTAGAGSVSLLANSMFVSGTITSAATIGLTADSLLINPTATIVSAADVALQTLTSSRGVRLGSEDASRLSLTDDELDRITAAKIRVTDASSSGFVISNPITYENHFEVNMLGSGETLIQAAVTMAPNKNFIVTHSTPSPENANIRLVGSGAIATSGVGAISLTAQAAFELGGGSLTTENGGITILAHGASNAFPYFSVSAGMGSVISTTGVGNISITGLSTTGLNGGMSVRGTIQSTSATNATTQGRIRLEGESGANRGPGVNIEAGTVSSNGGDIEIVGRGGTGINPVGITLDGAQIVADNAASISLTGSGGNAFSQDANGVQIHRGTSVSTQSGNIQIRGTGGSTDATGKSLGVAIGAPSNQGYVRSSSGHILIQGVGGNGPNANHGVVVNAVASAPFNSEVRTSSGSIVIDGTAGSGAGSYATSIQTVAQPFIIVPAGDLTFIGDSFQKTGGGQAASVSGGDLTYAPKTAGTPVSLGGADVLTGAKMLGLSNFDLDGMSAPRFIIGSNSSGNLSVDANIGPSGDFGYVQRDMDLLSGADIVFNARLSTLIGTGVRTRGSVFLSPGENGTVKPFVTGQDVVTSNAASTFPITFAPGATLAINIAGTTVDSQYNQLNASGAVNLAGADLTVTGAFVTALGQTFAIVSASTVSGQFNGLPEDCSFLHNGRSLRVNYTATTVTLTDVGQPPTIAADAAMVSTAEGSPATNTGTFNDSDGNATAVVTASIGTVTQDNGAGTWSWSIPTTDGPDGPFEVTITVTDEWCAIDQVTIQVTVNNLPPTVANAGDVTAAEGQTAANSGTWGDPGVDEVTLSASIGSIVKNGAGTWSWSFSTTDGPDQSQTVTITATDSDGAQSQTTFPLTVNNIAPEVTSLSASTGAVAQGGTVSFSGAFADPGVEIWQGTATIQRSGASDVVVPVALNPDKTFNFNYQFAAAGLHTVRVTVVDGDLGTPVSRSVEVNVVAPPSLPGDYDVDSDVDGFDFLLWQRQFGAATLPYAGADGDGNRVVAGGDLTVWSGNFGSPIVAASVPASSALTAADALAEGQLAVPLPAEYPAGARRNAVGRSGRAVFDAPLLSRRASPARTAYFDQIGSTEGAPEADSTRGGRSLDSGRPVDEDLLLSSALKELFGPGD